MGKLGSKIRNFFLAPADAPTWIRLLPFIFMGVLTVVVIVGSIEVWNYTNSNTFCGTTCHTMPPEYSAYLRSPHARVQCVECHLGRDTLTTQIPRKIAHSETLYALIFKTYEYPIVAKKMRPANEACETCHFPEKFSNDALMEIRHYAQDDANTSQSIFLLMHIGGGTARQGLGKGIHWHIENTITFVATDPMQQNIPYVKVVYADGTVKEYIDVASGFDPDQAASQQQVHMDCITCHNRVTHIVPFPQDAVAEALTKGLISKDLPNIDKTAIELLSQSYPDQAAADKAIDGLDDYYAQNYPQVHTDHAGDIQKAIDTLKIIYTEIRFPEQKLDWTSHPNNLGHLESPGCFRCHDGKHLTKDGEAIRLECNLCHDIPVVADPKQFVTNISVVRGPEPSSHTNTNWMVLHGKVIDETCAGCHPPKNPSVDYTKLNGKPLTDGSFCGNTVCHVSQWKYTGFGSYALKDVLAKQVSELIPPTPVPGAATPTPAPVSANPTYTDTIKPILDKLCMACHQGSDAMAGLDLSAYANIMTGNADGAGIVPEQPDQSLIFKIQNAGGHYGQMSSSQLAALKAWILAGAPEK